MRELPIKKKIKIKVQTPVHIGGTNTLLKNRDYYLKGKTIYRIHYPTLLKSLPPKNREETLKLIKNKGINALNPRPTKKPGRIKIEEDWKKALRAQVSQNKSEQPVQKSEKKSLLETVQLYQSSISFGNEQVANTISGLTADCLLRFSLPASTMKGALRTALYFYEIQKNSSCLERLRFTWTTNPGSADYPLSREISGFDHNKKHQDVFRYLILCNSQNIPYPQNVSVQQLKILNIKQDKVSWKANNKSYAKMHQGTSVYWEMLPIDTEMAMEIILLPSNKSFSLDKLQQAIKSFSAAVVDKELQFAKNYGAPFLEDFYNKLSKQINGGQMFLPIGSGLPWHAKTIGNAICEASLDNIRRHFYRHMGKFIHMPYDVGIHGMMIKRGKCPKTGKIIKPEKLKSVTPFPKTRHILFENGQPMYPPGWVQLSFGE